MFESIINLFKKMGKQEKEQVKSKDAAKERLHLVLMQDRANVSADFLDLMKQEIIEVIKKYIDVDENAIDVRLTNKANGDGTTGAPLLYANIPIISIKEEVRSGMARQKDITKPKEEVNKPKQNSKLTKEENVTTDEKEVTSSSQNEKEEKAEDTKENLANDEEQFKDSSKKDDNQEVEEKENVEVTNQ
jgi:cell division topological specificity factor